MQQQSGKFTIYSSEKSNLSKLTILMPNYALNLSKTIITSKFLTNLDVSRTPSAGFIAT